MGAGESLRAGANGESTAVAGYGDIEIK